ncbi:MFS transporter, partial [Aeromonas caviae]
PVAQPGPADGGGGAGGPVRRLAGRPDLALATADELAFATRVTFALTALLLMSALWLAGREERAVQGDVARDGCESGER